MCVRALDRKMNFFFSLISLLFSYIYIFFFLWFFSPSFLVFKWSNVGTIYNLEHSLAGINVVEEEKTRFYSSQTFTHTLSLSPQTHFISPPSIFVHLLLLHCNGVWECFVFLKMPNEWMCEWERTAILS